MNKPGNAEPLLGIDWASTSWKSRGYLPHYDSLSSIQSITFRLADSLPQEKLSYLKEQLKLLPKIEQEKKKRIEIEQWLDSGYGCCALQNQEMAKVMEDTLIKFDDLKYKLFAWCIMPNHVHVLIQPKLSLARIVQSWKSYTGKWAIKNNDNLQLGIPAHSNTERGLKETRAFWMREYWDRFIRDENHFKRTIEYIHQNPVKAGLCRNEEEWLWSSAKYAP